MSLELSSMIDHTNLLATATETDIRKLCAEAKQYNLMSVCVNPCRVKLAYKLLVGSTVKVCTVIGFPLGANSIETKVFEAKQALEDGAVELDMVINIGKLKDRNWEYIENEITQIKRVMREHTILKVIIETCYLTDQEKIEVCKISKQCGADFVKTSTGFGNGGATVDDIKLMRNTIGESMGVKASGGIRDLKTASDMIEAGANRLGCSASVKIIST